MKISQKIPLFILLIAFCLVIVQCVNNQPKKTTFLTGQGTGIANVTLMVQDIDSAITYFKDSLGFQIWAKPKSDVYKGTMSAGMFLGDLSSLQFLSINDSVSSDSIQPFLKSFLAEREGVRWFEVATSSADSTYISLQEKGFKTDSIELYQTSLSPPEGWSSDNPSRKRVDFDVANPPLNLPRFVEKVDYGYDKVRKEWKTYYIYRRMYNTPPNGTVGLRAVRILVNDLKQASKQYQEMGFELEEESDSLVRFQLYRSHEIHLMRANNQDHEEFLKEKGEGVFALRFDVEDLDSTKRFFENELIEEALMWSEDLMAVKAEHAFGVQLEFTNEIEEQKILAKTYTPSKDMDTLAKLHTKALYAKYCALCHGDNREGYAADNAPSLKSKSLLGTSMYTNFLRYTIQYGRANTAMAGYLETQGGPLEHIEVELLIQWLNNMAGVDEPIKLSKDAIEGDIELGAKIYEANCASCHGENGEGAVAPALGNPITLATASDHFLRYAIAEGRDDTPMIAFKDSLSDEEIDGVVAFLRSRSAGWDIPEPIPVEIPTPDEYVINPDAENPVFDLRDGKYASADQVNEAFQAGKKMIILDARSEVAWRQMHIPGAVPVPYYEEPENFINDIPKDGTQIVIYCACPHAASGRVMSTLRRNGFENTAIVDEGILVWAQKGYPVRNGG